MNVEKHAVEELKVFIRFKRVIGNVTKWKKLYLMLYK